MTKGFRERLGVKQLKGCTPLIGSQQRLADSADQGILGSELVEEFEPGQIEPGFGEVVKVLPGQRDNDVVDGAKGADRALLPGGINTDIARYEAVGFLLAATYTPNDYFRGLVEKQQVIGSSMGRQNAGG